MHLGDQVLRFLIELLVVLQHDIVQVVLVIEVLHILVIIEVLLGHRQFVKID